MSKVIKMSKNDFNSLNLKNVNWYIERLGNCDYFDFKEYIKNNHFGYSESLQIGKLFVGLDFNRITIFDIDLDEVVLSVELPFTDYNEILNHAEKIEKLCYFLPFKYF